MAKVQDWRGHRRKWPEKGGLTFNDWLKRAQQTHDPAGDLVGDLRTDETVPERIETAERLRNYLLFKHACLEAMAEIPEVWRRFERWRMLHRSR